MAPRPVGAGGLRAGTIGLARMAEASGCCSGGLLAATSRGRTCIPTALPGQSVRGLAEIEKGRNGRRAIDQCDVAMGAVHVSRPPGMQAWY